MAQGKISPRLGYAAVEAEWARDFLHYRLQSVEAERSAAARFFFFFLNTVGCSD